MGRSKRTRALSISQSVKERVYERDHGRCVWCGSRRGQPNAHFIPRSLSGLGCEANILTLCPECHRRYDETTERGRMAEYFERYLKRCYPGWSRDQLIYRKGMDDAELHSDTGPTGEGP